MDYINHFQRKRRHDGDNENIQSKRLCNGRGDCVQVEYGAMTDSPMDTWDTAQQALPNGDIVPRDVPNMVYSVQGKGGHCCPRCMAGEPGHINHIMRY